MKTRDGAHDGKLGQEGRHDRLLPELPPAPRHPGRRNVHVEAVQQQVRGRSGIRFNGTFESLILFAFKLINAECVPIEKKKLLFYMCVCPSCYRSLHKK